MRKQANVPELVYGEIVRRFGSRVNDEVGGSNPSVRTKARDGRSGKSAGKGSVFLKIMKHQQQFS